MNTDPRDREQARERWTIPADIHFAALAHARAEERKRCLHAVHAEREEWIASLGRSVSAETRTRMIGACDAAEACEHVLRALAPPASAEEKCVSFDEESFDEGMEVGRLHAFAEAVEALGNCFKWEDVSQLITEWSAIASAPKEQTRPGSSTGEQLKDPPRTVTGDAGSTPAPAAPLDRAALVEKARLFNIEDRGRAHGGLGSVDVDRLLALEADFTLSQLAASADRIAALEAELREVRTMHGAWTDAFGTTQLTHATAKLDQAVRQLGTARAELARAREERDRAIMDAQELNHAALDLDVQIRDLRDEVARLSRVADSARSLIKLYDARWTHGDLPAVSRLTDPKAGGEVWGDLLCALAALDAEPVPPRADAPKKS